MSGNFAIKGGGGAGPLMANAILNFPFDYPHPSLICLPDFKNGALVSIKKQQLQLSDQSRIDGS